MPNALLMNALLDAHVKNIRRKLGSCGSQLETVRGVGYRLRDV